MFFFGWRASSFLDVRLLDVGFQVMLLLQGFAGLTVKVITQNASLPKVLLGMFSSRASCSKECLKGASDIEDPTLS